MSYRSVGPLIRALAVAFLGVLLHGTDLGFTKRFPAIGSILWSFFSEITPKLGSAKGWVSISNDLSTTSGTKMFSNLAR